MTAVPSRPLLPLDKTARLVARSLGVSANELAASFRPAAMADLPQILALRAEVLGASITWDDAAYLAWRYRLGRPDQGGGECWVLMLAGEQGRELAGMIGTEALTLQWAQAQVPALRVMDILIQPKHEGKALGAWLLLAMRERAACVMAVGANANSKRLVERTYESLPGRRSFTHPLRFDQAMHKRLGFAPLAWLASRAAEAAMLALRIKALGLGWRGIKVSHLHALPDDVEDLIQASMNPARIEVLRSRAQWAWRLATPRARFDLWGARRQGKLMGLMIMRADTDHEGRTEWAIMDIVLDESMRDAALKALMWAVLTAARRHHVAYLSLISTRRDIEPLLRHGGFIEQPNAYRIMAWACQDEALRAAGEGGAEWSFNEIHSDGA